MLDFNENSFLPKIKIIEYYGKNKVRFYIDNLKKGLAVTIGCSLRRILLSFIPGYAITKVLIDGINHEYNAKDGLYEDIIDVLLNLKEIKFYIDGGQNELELHLKKTGGNVYASDFLLPHNVRIGNPDKKIATLINSCTLNMIVCLSKGFGYVPFFSFLPNTTTITHNYNNYQYIKQLNGNWLYLDPYFSPVKKVNYFVNSYTKSKYIEELVLEIETFVGKSSEECLKYAAKFLVNQLMFLYNFNYISFKTQQVSIKLNKILWDKIETLNFSIRTYNCLLIKNINYIGDLVQKFENDLLTIPNFGLKSLYEVKNILLSKGLTLGMYIKDWNVKKKNM